MNTKNLGRLKEHFEGKVCTVFTVPVCRDFPDTIWREHFAVRILEISADGIWAQHPYNDTKSFFFMEQVVFIQEEIELDPKNPVHAKMIKDYEKQTGKKVFSDVSPHLAPAVEEKSNEPIVEEVSEGETETAFIDIEKLNALAQMTKQSELMAQFKKNDDLVQIR